MSLPAVKVSTVAAGPTTANALCLANLTTGEGRGARTASPRTGNEPLAVERRRHEPPADAVEDQQRRPDADGQAEGGGNPTERNEGHRQQDRETRDSAQRHVDAAIVRARGERDADHN